MLEAYFIHDTVKHVGLIIYLQLYYYDPQKWKPFCWQTFAIYKSSNFTIMVGNEQELIMVSSVCILALCLCCIFV